MSYVLLLPGQAQILNEFFVGGMENQIELSTEMVGVLSLQRASYESETQNYSSSL